MQLYDELFVALKNDKRKRQCVKPKNGSRPIIIVSSKNNFPFCPIIWIFKVQKMIIIIVAQPTAVHYWNSQPVLRTWPSGPHDRNLQSSWQSIGTYSGRQKTLVPVEILILWAKAHGSLIPCIWKLRIKLFNALIALLFRHFKRVPNRWTFHLLHIGAWNFETVFSPFSKKKTTGQSV